MWHSHPHHSTSFFDAQNINSTWYNMHIVLNDYFGAAVEQLIQREKVVLSVENFTRYRIITRAVNERAKAWIIFKSAQTIMDIVPPNWSVKWAEIYIYRETFFVSHLTFGFFFSGNHHDESPLVLFALSGM